MRNNLEKLRKERKIGQEQLANAMGVSRQTIGSIENGRYNPSIVLAINIARYFGKSVEDIFQVEYESRWLDIVANLKEKNQNYEYNLNINQPDGLVLNQNDEQWSLYRYGKFSFGYNGGDLAAVYNVCKILSKDILIADIILEFEANDKAILGGLAGTDPRVLGEFFVAHKIEYSYYSEMPAMDKLVEEGKPFIVAYWVRNKIKELKGIHAVAGVYKNEKYIIYNAVNNSNEVLELDSIKELAKKSQVIAAYLFE